MLAEVPSQVVEYMDRNGFRPGVPDVQTALRMQQMRLWFTIKSHRRYTMDDYSSDLLAFFYYISFPWCDIWKSNFPLFIKIYKGISGSTFFLPYLRRWDGWNEETPEETQNLEKILTILTKQIYSFPKIKHCPRSSKYTLLSLQIFKSVVSYERSKYVFSLRC